MNRIVLGLVAILAGCSSDDPSILRGHGLKVATLAPNDQAHVYEAAARAAFDVDDPSLSLLMDSRILPRTTGLTSTDRWRTAIVMELRRRRVVKDICEPSLDGTRGTAHCNAPLPGYVLRFSPVFVLDKDSVQVYMYAQKYDTPNSGISETLRFERVYQVARRGDGWKAVREGQVPKEVREGKQ